VTQESDGNDRLFGDLGNDWLVGGTGMDEIWAGWGNDISQADDDLSTNGWQNDIRDQHDSYADRAYAGAGVDILYGNTFPDRLIDWVGEFNSYIVPFNPFGIDTVSRQVEPQLPEFLYAISASDGADQTRDYDTGAVVTRPFRNGEYEGELGLIIQQDHGYWQSQTGGPTDPQGPQLGGQQGGPKNAIAGANFNSNTQDRFAVDSGIWMVQNGTLQVAAGSLGLDAAAVFYLDEYKPTYFEIAAQIMAIKPTAGWNANAYVIFDYFSDTDFKFTGIDVSLNKLVMGYRDESGWHVVAQAPVLGAVKADTWYDMLVAINGTTTVVSVNGQQAFTHTFAPRMLNGEPVGLNKGFIGAGSNNSRGSWDNFVVQVLPPALTLDSQTTFTSGTGSFSGPTTGTWTAGAGRYASTAPSGETTTSIADYGVDGLQSNSHVEIAATLATNGIGGVVFDRSSDTRFKFVAVDVTQQRVLIGHLVGGSWVVDASVAKTLAANTDYTLLLTIRGTSVSVSVGGVFAVSFGFNAPVADGDVGVLSRSGTTSVDGFRMKTNDSHFTVPWVSVGDATVTEGAAGAGATATLTLTLSQAATAATSVGWSTVSGSASPGGDYIQASGIATFAAGSTTATISVSIVGDGVLEPDELLYIALSGPSGLTIGDDAGQVTIVNDDTVGPPTVTVTATDASGTETAGNPIVLTLTRSGSTAASLAVNVTWGGTASSTDYTISVVGGTLAGSVATFAAGSATIAVTIMPVDDSAVEGLETATLTAASGSGYTVGTPASASGTIADNDAATPSLSIQSPVSITEGRSGTTNATLTVTMPAASTQTVTVQYATSNGTATAGSDYVAKSGTLTFAPGTTSQTITIAVNGDRTAEANETFTVTLSNSTNATLGTAVATVTIVNDDGSPLNVVALAPSSLVPAKELTSGQLDRVVSAAKAAWIASKPDADFADLTVAIADLDGILLGIAGVDAITIDADAAGWGWTLAGGGIDLMTVVMHELGHVLGLDHDDEAEHPVMAAALAVAHGSVPPVARRPAPSLSGSRAPVTRGIMQGWLPKATIHAPKVARVGYGWAAASSIRWSAPPRLWQLPGLRRSLAR
jgi:hypothetical protein